MGSIDIVKAAVDRLYQTPNPNRAPLADWLYTDHVYQVAEAARKIAERFGGNPDLAYAAGLLHDVADSVVVRQDPTHAERSMEMARQILTEAGFTAEEIAIAVDDALRFHSCHGENRPQTLDGKALSTGDAIAHLTTNFYPHLYEVKKDDISPEIIGTWMREKIDRDYSKKIAYDAVRAEVDSAYSLLKQRFAI